MNIQLFSKFIEFNDLVSNSNLFFILRYFNSYKRDIIKLRLLCVNHGFILKRYKNSFFRCFFKKKKLKLVFIGTFFILFFRKKKLELFLNFLKNLKNDKLNFLIELVVFEHRCLTLFQFEKFLKLRLVYSDKKIIFFKLKVALISKFFFFKKLLNTRYANN